ncbi:uncharacterized protein LOC124138486 [Haliotis rufescens]|uniref:uncharacterized protein LOC124138486 n=1 Tax=Haliotis rufescens TaxID=6454 RepID=UPI001EB041BE|nr:uncharacterized protein LOC124138486 [Haliotis rufescens]
MSLLRKGGQLLNSVPCSAAMIRACIFGLLIGVSQAFLFDFGTSNWNGLKVTWDANIFSSRAFSSLPRTESDAKRAGFTMISDCGAKSNFAGKRYVLSGDTAVVLLYDVNGYIAGIQAGFPATLQNGYPHAPLKNHPFVMSDGKQYITAYFVDPSTICSKGRTSNLFNSEGTGTDLFIQNGTTPSQILKIPHKETDVQKTMWTKGHCFPTMGVHYWYNIRKDMSCDEFYPVFLLYNGGKLNAFGWAFNADLSSTRFEHPPLLSFGAFLNPVPDCLSKEGRLSTMHIYLTSRPELDTC